MSTNHIFKPVILSPADRWRLGSFDLRYDAKWTHQAGSSVFMDREECVIVRVDDREKSAISGMRFSTGDAWVRESTGRKIRLYLETSTVSNQPLPFRIAYLPKDSTHSGFYNAFANTKASTFSFDFEVPADTLSETHLIVVDPLEDNTELVVFNASLTIL